jgi:spermidine synthase
MVKGLLTRPGVTSITVVEISQDIVDLVTQYGKILDDPKVTVVVEDALVYPQLPNPAYNWAFADCFFASEPEAAQMEAVWAPLCDEYHQWDPPVAILEGT